MQLEHRQAIPYIYRKILIVLVAVYVRLHTLSASLLVHPKLPFMWNPQQSLDWGSCTHTYSGSPGWVGQPIRIQYSWSHPPTTGLEAFQWTCVTCPVHCAPQPNGEPHCVLPEETHWCFYKVCLAITISIWSRQCVQQGIVSSTASCVRGTGMLCSIRDQLCSDDCVDLLVKVVMYRHGAYSETKCDYDSQNGVMPPKQSNNMLINVRCTLSVYSHTVFL